METKTTTKPELPTWKILNDGGNHFQWNFCCSKSDATTAQTSPPPQNPISSLPSMSDLLLKESSKIIDEPGNDRGSVPMFRTGGGKPVAVKQSSIRKALSVLGEGELLERDQLHKHVADHGCSSSNSLFQTGSGKKVNISSAGLIKAKTLLGLENYNPCASQGPVDTKKQSGVSGFSGWGMWSLEKHDGAILGIDNTHSGSFNASSFPTYPITCPRDRYPSGIGNQSKKDVVPNLLEPDMCSLSKQPPVKFQTAGGRSILVSSDALQRARNLLGESDLETTPIVGGSYDPPDLFLKGGRCHADTLYNKDDVSHTSFSYQNSAMNQYLVNRVPAHEGSLFNQEETSRLLEGIDSRDEPDDVLKHVDSSSLISEEICKPSSNVGCMQQPPSDDLCATDILADNSSVKDLSSRVIQHGRSSGKPLIEISNSIEGTHANQKKITSEKRRLGRKSSISSFKRPRISRFSAPLNSNVSFPSSGLSTSSAHDGSCFKRRVSTRYPFQVKRRTMKEYFGGPPHNTDSLIHLSNEVKYMNADSAEKYLFHAASGLNGIGTEAVWNMLAQFGASLLHASKDWVANHYKWIVWKLACLERGYPAQASGKFLTLPNVLEELKYRYEREVNHGHKSAVKRILEGDASPASTVVLCISAIRSCTDSKLEEVECPLAPYEDPNKNGAPGGAKNTRVAKIELTDGWYSLDAHLDEPLSNQLAAGKLFVGQKLRIWGADLRGWVAPVSPLEAANTVSLIMRMNGTYRAQWDERLGFSKGIGAPLAFRCINCAGGLVPRTLVGVTRIYPILYRERLADGGFAVRSERMESRVLQLYNQRRSTIAEGILFENQKDNHGCHTNNDSDSEEGAKIFKLLEKAAEPEFLMAEMSSEQLNSFASYQAKREAIRQSYMQQKVEKALNDAGLSDRQVTPLMRVRVVGLTTKFSWRKAHPREGLITIWNPTEKQVILAEGKIYCIGGLVPLYSHSNVIHLQARGSTTTWQPLPPSALECFEPFFTPRKSILLSNLGEVPLASEFDTAAVVVFVGDVYLSGNQKKQWVFVTDGSESRSELQLEGPSICLLAVCFCSSRTKSDTFAPVDPSIAGSTAAFCNLVKQARDPVNDLWVAEATENSSYLFSYDLRSCSHLKEALDTARKWAKISSVAIQKLKERVLYIIGGCESLDSKGAYLSTS